MVVAATAAVGGGVNSTFDVFMRLSRGDFFFFLYGRLMVGVNGVIRSFMFRVDD